MSWDTRSTEYAAARQQSATRTRARHAREAEQARSRTASRQRTRADVEAWAPRVRSATVTHVHTDASDGSVGTDGQPLVTLDLDGASVEAEWLLLPEVGDRVRVLLDPGGHPLVLGTPKGTPPP